MSQGVSFAGLRAVILTYGTGGQYLPLLESLLDEGVEPEQVLIVHNPSAAGEQAPTDTRGCETVLAPYNLGYAAGMNLGIERVLDASELLLLLTHDARLRSGSLAQLVDAAERRPELGVVAPVLVYSGTDTPYSFGGIDRGDGSVGHLQAAPAGSGEVLRCDWVDGGTMLIRAESVRRVGGFDERLWGYTEEAELCLRVRRAGYRVGVVAGARADQDPGGPKRPGPWAYLTTRNGLAYAARSTGARGVAFIAARAALVIGHELVRALARGARIRKGDPGEPWAVAVGMARGIVDYFRGRWGPPPTSLPGAGDMRNLAPASE